MAERGTARAIPGGLRTRILGWYVVLLVVAIAASVLLLREILLTRLDDEVESSLVQEAGEVRRLASGRDPATGQPFDGNARAIFDTFLSRNIPGEGEALFTFVDGEPYKSSFGAPYSLDQDAEFVAEVSDLTTSTSGELATPAGRARYLAVPLRQDGTTRGVFVVTNFVRQEREEVATAVQSAAGVAVGVVALASVLAWWVAGRALRPLRQLSDSARSITETDLTRRMKVQGSDEIAELTETLNAMLGRLEAAFATQRAFVDDAGHELRTPITIIRGHLEVMSDDPEDRRDTIALVFDELGRMARIVDDLLLLARAEQPGFLELEPVDVAQLTTELHAKAAALAARRWQVAAAAEVTVLADRQRLTQAMINLADNAARHTDDSGTITLGSEADDGHVRFWVADDGPGVPAAERERIFERFTRGQQPRRSEGAGLGLAIVAAIAEAHGGHVELDSAEGGGARFSISIPFVAEPERAQWRAS